jgi:hypothetical protein
VTPPNTSDSSFFSETAVLKSKLSFPKHSSTASLETDCLVLTLGYELVRLLRAGYLTDVADCLLS